MGFWEVRLGITLDSMDQAMSFFKKLDISMDVRWILSTPYQLIQTTDISKVDEYKYASWADSSIEPTPLLMFSLLPDVEKQVIDLLPDALKDAEVPRVHLMKMKRLSKSSNMLYPHVDRGRRVAINFYLVCGDETTRFFEADEGTRSLTPVAEFCAKEGECWMLDVSKPHAVIMNAAPERIGLSLSYRRSRYEDLGGSLEMASQA
jgi:hypothetical protein